MDAKVMLMSDAPLAASKELPRSVNSES